MDKLVITPDAHEPFFLATGDLELCDPQGRTVGYFVRSDDQFVDDPALYEWVKKQVTAEELERRQREPGARTTAEVLARLDAL